MALVILFIAYALESLERRLKKLNKMKSNVEAAHKNSCKSGFRLLDRQGQREVPLPLLKLLKKMSWIGG